MDKKRSWACTLTLQLFLCIVVYISLNFGEPHMFLYQSNVGRSIARPVDVYFLSVRGGFRPIKHQIHLLKLMEKVALAYKAKFVVNISELGEDDPLTHNGTRLFSSINVPWYATSSKSAKVDCFLEQVNVTHGKTLTIAGLNSKSLKDLVLARSSSSGNNDLNWLIQILKSAAKNWLIVVGYQPVVVCEEKEDKTIAKLLYEPLHHIFTEYGVNAYLSTQGCMNHTLQGGVSYIGITNCIKSKLYQDPSNGSSGTEGEMDDGFLLHRVSSQEIGTYFVTMRGEVWHKVVIQQGGKAIM